MILTMSSVIALGIKLIALIGLVLYIIFAVIIVRQEQLMAGVLEESTEPVVRLITIIHLFGAIGCLVCAVIFLPWQ